MMVLSCGEKEKGGDAGGGSAVSLDKQIIGYWAMDPSAIEAKAKEEAGDDPTAAAMIPMMVAMMSNMVIEITATNVNFVGMGDEDVSTYEITKTDDATKTLTMSVTEDGEKSEATAKVDGDKLTLSKDGDAIDLNRITKEEFEKRKNAKPPEGGPGGAPPTPPTE